MFATLRHLLPDSVAWRLVAERILKKYLRGVASVGDDARAFIDDVYNDLWPQTTRQLGDWQKQFNAEPWGTEQQQRNYLDYLWSEERAQGPDTLQSHLRAAGFADAHVYEAFDSLFLGMTAAGRSQTFTPPTLPGDVAFSDDGFEMFLTDQSPATVRRYTLTAKWDVTTASANGSLAVGGTYTTPWGIFLQPGGGAFYLVGFDGTTVSKFTMTGYDVTTAVFAQSFSVGVSQLLSVLFNEAGTRMWVTRDTANGVVLQYNLSTPWDLSTAVVAFSLATGGAPTQIAFRQGKLLVLDIAVNRLREFTAPNGLSVQGATDTGLFQVFAGDLRSAFFGSDNQFWILFETNSEVREYSVRPRLRNPNLYTNKPLFGTTQCGEPGTAPGTVIAECGEQPPDQVSSLSATCNRFLANEVWYLVNDNLNDEAPPPVPDDADYYPHFWYVGGKFFGDNLDIGLHERERFERICLRHGPAHQWVVTMIDLWDVAELGAWRWRAGAIAAGEARLDSASVYHIWKSNLDGVDRAAELLGLAGPTRIRFTVEDTKWLEYAVVSAADGGSYVAVTVSNPSAEASDGWTGFTNGGVITISTKDTV